MKQIKLIKNCVYKGKEILMDENIRNELLEKYGNYSSPINES